MWEWGFLSNDKITFALTLGGLHMMSIVTASYIPWSEVLCFVHFDHTELWRNMDQTVQILYLLFSRKCSCLVLGWGVDGGWTRVCVVVVVGGGGQSLDPRSKTHHHAFTTHFVAASHPWPTWLKVFLCCVQRCCRPRWGDLQVFRHWYSTTTLSSMPNSGLCLLHGTTTKNTKHTELAQRGIAL